MAQRKTLTTAQVDLLRWVGEGCPDGVYEGVHHRISVAALLRRGLVAATGHGDRWSAEITDAGQAYLALVDGPRPPIARQATLSVSDQLIADVIAAGGTLRVPKRAWGGRGVDWERRVAVAIEHRKVPVGKELSFHRLRDDEDEVRLDDLPEDMVPMLSPVAVPEQVRRYHPVVREFREARSGLDVSKAAMLRVSLLLQALVVEAEARRYSVAIVGEHAIGFAAEGHTSTLAVSEVGVRHQLVSRRAPATPDDPYGMHSYRREWVRDDSKASGRLAFEFVPHDRNRHRVTKWVDRRGTRIEDVLPEILAEVPIAAAEARHRQQEAELRAAVRQAEWEQAMTRARDRHHDARCREELDRQVGRWREATRIREYATAVAAAYADDSEASEWVVWARWRASQIDPLTDAPRAPERQTKVKAEDLRPYLKGWSPYGPDASY